MGWPQRGIDIAAAVADQPHRQIVQAEIDDVFRGRVFSVYDVMFNVTFVAAAVVAATVLPPSGKSYAALTCIAIGYVATAAWYWRRARASGQSRGQPVL